MITVRLQGGLGNQMFQYSTGLSLARRHRVPLYLDLSLLRADPKRDYMLDRFGVRHGGLPSRLRIDWWRIRQPCVVEPHFHYWDQFASLPTGIFIQGYWQSPRYFADLRNELQKTFVPVARLPESMRTILGAIRESESVGIHVRRGDYVNDPTTHAFHGVCDLAYYQAATKGLQQRVTEARWFVFSDDPGWVRTNLHLGVQFELISGRSGLDPIQEWWLLSRCRHHVVANSSFSWWAAWLGGQKGKTVVAPRHWFADPRIDSSDLIPAEWLRL